MICEEKDKHHFEECKNEMKELIEKLNSMGCADQYKGNVTIMNSF